MSVRRHSARVDKGALPRWCERFSRLGRALSALLPWMTAFAAVHLADCCDLVAWCVTPMRTAVSAVAAKQGAPESTTLKYKRQELQK